MDVEVHLESILDQLEDINFDSCSSRSKAYEYIKEVFDGKGCINVSSMDRLMAIIEKDLQKKDTTIVSALSVLMSIVKKVEKGECTPHPDLLASFIIILNILEDMENIETVKQLLFNALSCYPDNVLLQAYLSNSGLVKGIVFDYSFIKNIMQNKEMPVQLFIRLLKILPPEEKHKFVTDHIDLWFFKVIPKIVEFVIRERPYLNAYIEAAEVLTEVLVNFEYEQNPAWLSLFACICTPNSYPAILKKMIEKSQNSWHRLWIIFVKLLKENITRQKHGGVSPINVLLPVVECAFKMRTEDRCRAFECWTELIKSFAKEQNENHVQKRVRLLMIPLKSNNTKTEGAALGKLNTWWYLIRSFEDRLEKFIDLIVLPFLHLCYGKHDTNIAGTSLFSMVYFPSATVKKLCVEMFVEMTGHVNCQGCTNIPRLTKRIISIKLLIDYWNDWVHSLSSAIKMAGEVNDDAMKQCVSCMWKSMLLTICELPPNNIRKDLFNVLLNIVQQLPKESSFNNGLADITIGVLITSLFEEDNIKQLLQIKDSTTDPLHTIFSVILHPCLNDYYERNTFKDIVSLFKPITNFIVTESKCPCPPSIMNWNEKDLMPNDNSFMLWTALVESICELDCGSAKRFNLSNLLLWPMRNMKKFNNAKAEFAWYKWHTLYELMRMKVNRPCTDRELLNILSVHHESKDTPVFLQLIAALALLKQNLVNANGVGFEMPGELVIKLIDNEHNFLYVEKIFPVIVDVLALCKSKVMMTEDVVLAKFGITALKALLPSLMKLLKLNEYSAHNMTVFESLVNTIDTILQVNAYFPLKDIILDQLLECIHKMPSIKDTMSTHLRTLLSTYEQNELEFKKNETIVSPGQSDLVKDNDLTPTKQDSLVANVSKKDNLKNINNVDPISNASCNDDLRQTHESYNCNFIAPDSNTKKSKKKEPNIVNTVIENGEEYVVVKSNWRFNPKKLTENQKEKLKKKREDIPALYQDLSQSQDEFRITAWKVDSQDSSTTSSKSASKSASEDVSTILKNMPSSEVVPKIIETMSLATTKRTDNKNDEIICNDGSPKQAPAVKEPKTPRLALKDRVFRNVRNLMEKSGLRNENEISIELNKTITEINKTPNASANVSASLANSAPSIIHSERPSRVIKKPKKFEDSNIFALKKRRRFETDSQSGSSESSRLHEGQLNQTGIIKDIGDSDDNEILPMHPTTSGEKGRISVEKQLVPDTTENVPVNSIETVPILEKCEPITEHTFTIDKNDDKINVGSSIREVDTTSSQEGQDKNQDDVLANNSQKISPKSITKTKEDDQSSVQKKRSRIEKQLMIDMVEGHPLLQARAEERFTRKKMSSATNVIKRKSLAEKMNRILKTERKTKEKAKSSSTEHVTTPLLVIESQDRLSGSSDDLPASEDIIESSQDSSITAISVKSATNSAKKVPVVKLNKMKEIKSLLNSSETQRLLNNSNNQMISLSDITLLQPESITISPPINCTSDVKVDQSKVNTDCRKKCATQEILGDFNNDIPLNDSITSQHETDDISLPKNKTMLEENTVLELTENMNTQPFDDKNGSSDVIISNDDQAPIEISYSEELPYVALETQEIAEADTEPINLDSQIPNTTQDNVIGTEIEVEISNCDKEKVTMMTEGDLIHTNLEAPEAPLITLVEPNNACSPLKDATQKKKDFLNDTIEISPIKTLSPVREGKSPSPETNDNYVVIKLTSPVQSNGEPFNENSNSPEIFTEDKNPLDNRDQSPPRIEVPVTNNSPSSSLSLKKNRLQMRPSGRAAQMLGLCAPDKLKAIMNSDKSVESDDSKKSSSSMNNTPARRNLRILYNSVGDSNYHVDNDNPVNESEQEENESFLKFKRMLPSANSSPVGPILKRKLVDIADESTVSPASKRKRVSFHDPPVSTMVSIQKYIEPLGTRSPQSSTLKQLRSHNNLKSPKRLDNVFKLDNILTKAVESFSEDISMISDDAEMSSIDQTPAVEVIKTSELNDTDPICPDLLNCKDSIVEIAAELSSPAMKNLLIKELEGKVETIADLAKMTELEVNRLCIKAPKVEVVTKVLADYCVKKSLVGKAEQSIEKNTKEQKESNNRTIDLAVTIQATPDQHNQAVNMEVQTDQVVTYDMALQTDVVPVPVVSFIHTQTDITPVLETSVQTIETGYKSTKEFIATCLSERSDFVEELAKQLEESSVRQIAGNLPTDVIMDVLTKKITESDTTVLSFVQNQLCERFESNDLILFCSQLLQKLHDKFTTQRLV